MRVLILCTGNSARSQMAEGVLKSLAPALDVHSAGTVPAPRVNPYAIRAMQEIGIDISGQRTKPVDRFLEQRFDYVICVCHRAAERCPPWPRSKEQLNWSFDDPAVAPGTEAARLQVFRRVRNEIQQRINLALLAAKIHVPSREVRGAS